jgi:RNA polymerase sigma-70 factor, ECF subfamily
MTDDTPAAADESLRLHLLVLRCQAGDDQAFARLYHSFSARTLAHLRGLIRDDAEDVQQEVWLTVYRSIRTLGNPDGFRTWLYRTTRHRAIDFLRKRRRQQELVDEVASMAQEATSEPDAGLPEIDPAALDRAIAELPALQREALLLRYRDHLSYADIAVVVGCPLGTVRTRLHHAKRRLEERFKRGHS